MQTARACLLAHPSICPSIHLSFQDSSPKLRECYHTCQLSWLQFRCFKSSRTSYSWYSGCYSWSSRLRAEKFVLTPNRFRAALKPKSKCTSSPSCACSPRACSLIQSYFLAHPNVSSLYKNFCVCRFSKDQQNRFWFLLFGYFWTTEFIIASGQTIVAACVASYYFTRDKSRIGNGTVAMGVRLVARYHLGSVAFGACLVGVVRLVQSYLTCLEKYANSGEGRLQKLTLRCLQCCAACLERCIKYIPFRYHIRFNINAVNFLPSTDTSILMRTSKLPSGARHFVSRLSMVTISFPTTSPASVR